MLTILTRLRELLAQIPLVPRALRLVWQAAGWWTLGWCVLLLAQSLVPLAVVLLTRVLVDRIALGMGSAAEFAAVLPLVALMFSLVLLEDVLSRAAGYLSVAQAERVRDHILGQVHAQATRVDLAFFDDPASHDTLHRVRTHSTHRPTQLLEGLGQLATGLVSLLAMAIVLVPYGALLPLALVASTVPALCVILSYALRQREWTRRTTEDSREAEYYGWLLTSPYGAADIRVFDLGQQLGDAHDGLRTKLRNENLALARHRSIAEVLATVAAIAISAPALGWMVWRTIAGAVTLGELAMCYTAFSKGQKLLRSSLAGSLGRIYTALLYLGDLFKLLDLQPALVAPAEPVSVPRPLRAAVRFEGVHFRYPGSDQRALDGLDLEIPAGQMVALVGANGAGKSTVIRLLCRLYDPQRGQITIDRTDLRSLDPEALRRNLTVLFQAPLQFSITAEEQITQGDVHRPVDRSAIEVAVRAAKADEVIARLPDGYKTRLGRTFQGGCELSVGEWQRLLLARAFYRQAPLLLLDEPTSALDSWAEADWMNRLREHTADQTVVLVTHRLTTALHADRICVMEGGRLVEQGSHEELLELDGRYASAWRR